MAKQMNSVELPEKLFHSRSDRCGAELGLAESGLPLCPLEMRLRKATYAAHQRKKRLALLQGAFKFGG
jgi:hypothetical protein